MISVNSKGTARKIPTQRQASKVGPVRLNKRGKLWAKIIGVFVIFLVGVGMGHSQGVKDGHGQVPATIQAQLTWCEAHSKTTCHAEYMLHTPAVDGAASQKGDTGPAGWDVIADSAGQVADFNDGFATSKQDDCQQGFKSACDWAKTAK